MKENCEKEEKKREKVTEKVNLKNEKRVNI